MSDHLTSPEIPTCKWKLLKSGEYMSGCLVFHGDDGMDGYKFCPYCGHKLEVIRND
jgi:hypothetical protein